MNRDKQPAEIESLRRRVAELEDVQVRLTDTERALRESEERFRLLYENAPLGYQSLNEEGRIVEVNPAWLETLGYPREEVIGRRFVDFLAPDYQDHFKAHFIEFKAAKEFHRIQFDMVRNNGSTISVTVDWQVGRDQFGHSQHTLCMMSDLTELKRSRRELGENQERLLLALDGTDLGIWDWDLTVGKALRSERTLGMLGYEATELEPNLKNWKQFVHPDDWPGVSEKLNLHIQGRAPRFEAEYRIRDKSGEWRWTQAKGSVVEFDEAKKPIRMTGVVLDIDERKKAEEALRQSEQKYKTLVEDSFDGIFLQKGTKIVFANKPLHEMLGYEPGELIGKDHWIIYHPEDQPMTRARAQARLRGKSVIDHYEVRLQSKEGTVLDGEIRAKVLSFEKELGIQVWVRDISEQKRSKEKFQTLVENAPFGLTIIEEDGRFSYCSPRVADMFGYSPEDIPDGSTWMRRAYPDADYRREVIATWVRDMHEAKPGMQRPRVFTVTCKDGTQKDVLFRPVQLRTGQHLMTLDDITDRKRAEEELQLLNRALRTSSECSQALVHAPDEGALLDDVCRILVERGGYRMAWIGFAEQDEAGTIRPVAQAGIEDGYQKAADTPWSDTKRSRDPTGTAIRTGHHVIARNISADPEGDPWSEAALKLGCTSSVALPLKREDRVFGALMVYAAEPDAFAQQEVRLLSELADDLAYGITALRVDAERKEAEKRLVENERKYRELVEHANSIIVRWTHDGKITFLNEFGLKFFGYSSEEILGRHVVGTIVPKIDSSGRDLGSLMDQILADPKAYEQNVNENMRRSGERVEIAWTNKIVPEEQGHSAEVLSIGTDITELKRAQEEIKERNEELRSINRIVSAVTGFLDRGAVLDQVLDEVLDLVGLEGGAICLVAPNGTLELTANRATSEATIQDPTSRSVRVGDCLCGECARTLEPLILRNRDEALAYAPRESTRGELIRFHAAFPLVTASRCVGVLCVFTRTERKPSEQRLKLLETVTGQVALAIENAQLYEASQRHAVELERIVAERTGELARAKERAETADHLKSAFLATMSHELRTPLNSIIGFTGIVLKGLAGPLNAEQTKQLEMVRSSSRHLLALINDVLDISRIEAGQLQVVSERFDIRASINKVVNIVVPLAKKKGLALRTEIAPEVHEAIGDQRRVEQILFNLLNNAIKFTDNGEVALNVEQVPDFKLPDRSTVQPAVRLHVSDTGIGIKPDDLKTLFQPFRQIESGLSRNYEGTGLGLAICRRLADLMGGSMSVESAWMRGSTFSFTLPIKGSSQS